MFVLPADSPLQSIRTGPPEPLLRQRSPTTGSASGSSTAGARVADFVERYVIDGTIHGFERLGTSVSNSMRRGQSGLVSDYASYVVLGVIGLLVLLLFVAPLLLASVGGP